MIYYHCDRCKKRQEAGDIACWSCGQSFPRPVPLERPLIVVVDRETRRYAVYDGEGDINMSGIPARRYRNTMRHHLNAEMRRQQPVGKKRPAFGANPWDYAAAAFIALCAIGLFLLVFFPNVVAPRVP